PRTVADARFLPMLTYEQALELARAGAKVLHPMAVEYVASAAIPLWIRNTFEPDHRGTIVSREQ
ncbi:MAG: aspartate kinase, partial [Acidobacteria bacterium]